MIRLEYEIFRSGLTNRKVARSAQVAECTLSRILHGKQHPDMDRGGTADRLALAVGWPVDRKAELFDEIQLDDATR